MTHRAAWLAMGLLVLTVAAPARGALPAAFGGRLVLPAQAAPCQPDPRRLDTPLEASVVDAVFDTLYASDARGRLTPVLASGMPRRIGDTVQIPLRADVKIHGGELLRAADVIASLERALANPHSAWLLSAFARREAGLDATATDDHTLTLRMRDTGADVAHLLACRPLAITVGRRGHLGTGPYRARLERGSLRLTAQPASLRGEPYLRELRFTTPTDAMTESRELALGQIDASWVGSGVYGHASRVRTALGRSAPVILIRNRATGPMVRNGAWGRVIAAIARRRLRRLGLEATSSISYALPAPTLPEPTGAAPARLSLLTRAGHPLESALGHALAAMLDDAGVLVEVRSADPEAYSRMLASGRYDLRFETIVPPLLSPSAILGAAFAASGQAGEARQLARLPNLIVPGPARAAAARLDAFVLGRRSDTLTHDARLGGVEAQAFDGLLHLVDLHLSRPTRDRHTPQPARTNP